MEAHLGSPLFERSTRRYTRPDWEISSTQIGGIGSLKGALVASLLIGFADTFGKVLVPELAGVAVYLLMAIVLLFRPAGLFGRT